MEAEISKAVAALPARLTRTDLAELLTGADSASLLPLRDHPMFGVLDEHTREAVRRVVDGMVRDGTLALARNRLVPADWDPSDHGRQDSWD